MNIRSFVACIMVLSVMATGVNAQQKKEPKKVVIIKKTDENGKTTESKKEAEGAEADHLLKEMEEDVRMEAVKAGKDGKKIVKIEKSIIKKSGKDDGEPEEMKEIEISSKMKDGTSKERYKIIKIEGDQEKIIEWNGDGEMPEELTKELANININKDKEGNVITITVDDEDKAESEDAPDKIVFMNRGNKERRRHQMMWNDDEDEEDFPGHNRMFEMKAPQRENNNKVSLGVMIDDTDNGVIVTDIVKGSAAESAGLRRGDVVLKINEKYIFTSNGLLSALNPFNPDEKVKIRYIRDGKEKCGTASLKSRN